MGWAVLWALLLAGHLAELLRLVEPRGPKPPPAEARNSTGLVAFTAGGELRLRTNSAPRTNLAEWGRLNGAYFCDPQGRRPCRPGAERLGGMGARPNLADLGGAGGGVLANQRVGAEASRRGGPQLALL